MDSEYERLLDQELEAEHELALQKARSYFLAFVKYVTPGFQINWHHVVIANQVDRIFNGQESRVMLFSAPRHGKSELISRHLPAYIFGKNPDQKIIACSHTADLAQAMCSDVKRIIDGTKYQAVFADTKLAPIGGGGPETGGAVRRASYFEIVGRRGQYQAAGVGQAVVGKGADWLLLDDLVGGAEAAMSVTIREKTWQWYTQDARPRLHPGGRIFLLNTRWTDDDVPGRAIDQAKSDPEVDQWTVINLPAINEDGPTEYDPRQPGEAMWPDRYPVSELTKIRAQSLTTWQAQYQGNPAPPGGAVIKTEWWRRYGQAEVPRRFEKMLISADLTFKDKAKSDFTVLQVWGRYEGRAYLLDMVRRKLAFTGQLQAVLALHEQWPHVREIAIEDAANGAAIVDALRAKIPYIVGVPVGQSSKLTRAEAISPIAEAGNICIPQDRDKPWVTAFVTEWQRFPTGKHDDVIDAAVLGILRVLPNRPAFYKAGPLSFTKKSLTHGL